MIEQQNSQIMELSNLERDLNNMKLDFYTHVSHEIRTPLSLIAAPIEKLMEEEKDAGKRRYLERISRNVVNIQQLIDQVMDLRKIDVKELKLQPSLNDIVAFTHNIVRSFTDLAESSQVALKFSSEWPDFTVMFDKVKLERALVNLISNAIKFTPKDGEVEVSLSNTPGMVRMTIRDTGKGIPGKHVNEIFNPFYQVPDTQYGTGIGLTIVKEYIHLHKGEIKVESEEGKGTTFIISLPVTISDDVRTSQVKLEKDHSHVASPAGRAGYEAREARPRDKRYTLLIIDDNKDIVNYLEEELSSHFEIMTAYNGESGLASAHDKQPDLVIADVMMPVMDGIEFCKHLKTTTDTSHIPVILLTAKTAEEHQVEGYETGADDYITKPFNMKVLMARIENIIAQREKLYEQFVSSPHELGPQEVTDTKSDQEFLERAYRIIRQNLDNHEFGVSELVDQMNVSRSLMHTKLKKLVNLSTSEFIMIVRLRSAARMMRNSSYTISQIAFEVGFSDPTYFTKMFKKYFNQTPSEYRT